jgi:hypothetical protein
MKRDFVYWISFVFVLYLIFSVSFANSYVISQTNEINYGEINISDYGERIVDVGMSFLFSLISIKEIGFVSALGEVECCIQDNAGAWCQIYDSGEINSKCPADKIVSSGCNEVSLCQIGTCIDPEQGLCTSGSPRINCEDGNGEWIDDPNSNVQECRKGCCVLGENVEYTTEARCDYLSITEGYENDYRQVDNEIECLAMKETVGSGACVFENSGDKDNCRFGTINECIAWRGEFYENLLCSNPSLNTNCEKQDSVQCVEGKDEIYWFDSCGNRENIYSIDKDSSWNGGKILSKVESCNPNSDNADSQSCGNCNYFLGSICSNDAKNGVEETNLICKDLSCIDEDGNERTNGESWCVYDSYVGEGKDTVGSRHWKRVCKDGVVEVDPCADYRGEICVESDYEGISTASCVINRAMECINSNQEDPDATAEACSENSHCILTEVSVDEGFEFSLCTAQVPAGFELKGEDERSKNSAKQLCSYASQECTVIYEKKVSGWECISNCECETKKFAQEMNNLCVGLGDCGSYINFVGDGTDNADVENSDEVSWSDYKKYLEWQGEKLEPDSLEYTAERIGFGVGVGEDGFYNALKFTAGAAGASGALVMLGMKAGKFISPSATTLNLVGTVVPFGPNLGAFSSTLMSVGIGFTVGSMFAKMLGIQGQGALIISIAATVIGANVASMLGLPGLACVDPISCIIVAIIIIALVIILGIGKTKEVIVEFSCKPWQAPTGGSNCEKCNDDPLKPCSEYRCSSLGASCQLINENSKNPQCITTKDDGKSPIISEGSITSGYKFENDGQNKISIKKENGECIEAFEPIIFNLNTDERAQCKYDVRKIDYDEMSNSPISGNYYETNHTFAFSAPSLESLQSLGIEITGDIRQRIGDYEINVRCQDVHGNKNNVDYVVDICVSSGPDLTAPRILKTDPKSGKFKKDVTEVPLTVYLSEPATCRYDILKDKLYSEMAYDMECVTEVNRVSDFGWTCGTTLSGLTPDENNFYIKCSDQPWLIGTENESRRNPTNSDYVLTLSGTEEDLVISTRSPRSGIIERGNEPTTINLEIQTSGGADGGNAQCGFSMVEGGYVIPFKETGGKVHKQNGMSFLKGEYLIGLTCEDSVGNVALGNIDFTLNLDSSPPKVVRAYNSGGLTIVTNEEAKCYYDFNKCNFDLGNATIMDSSSNNKHSTEWIEGRTYHIKCEDKWANENSECAIKITPGAI